MISRLPGRTHYVQAFFALTQILDRQMLNKTPSESRRREEHQQLKAFFRTKISNLLIWERDVRKYRGIFNSLQCFITQMYL